MTSVGHNFLKLSYLDDGDYECGLRAEARMGDFAGVGEAWFGIAQVLSFLTALAVLSEKLEGAPELVGGFWSTSTPSVIQQINLGIRCYPISKTGAIGVHINLALDPYTGRRDEEVPRVCFELRTVPGLIDRFLLEARTMVNCKAGFATLEGDVV